MGLGHRHGHQQQVYGKTQFCRHLTQQLRLKVRKKMTDINQENKIVFTGSDRASKAEEWIKNNPDTHIKQYEFYNETITLYLRDQEDE